MSRSLADRAAAHKAEEKLAQLCEKYGADVATVRALVAQYHLHRTAAEFDDAPPSDGRARKKLLKSLEHVVTALSDDRMFWVTLNIAGRDGPESDLTDNAERRAEWLVDRVDDFRRIQRAVREGPERRPTREPDAPGLRGLVAGLMHHWNARCGKRFWIKQRQLMPIDGVRFVSDVVALCDPRKAVKDLLPNLIKKGVYPISRKKRG